MIAPHIVLLLQLCLFVSGFTGPRAIITSQIKTNCLFMSNDPSKESPPTQLDPMESASMDSETSTAMEKARRAEELRAQEVFMQRSTGKSLCLNCDWVYDETKGDSMMIGGMVKPGTAFGELPSNWRCPVCRASKDSFEDEVIEIPGFEVNQGYGFGTNSWTAGQKNGLIFGGLGLFFILFLSGYALN
mmetsp:Transcript_25784/g.29478  ORF Transcript_25784/g.29478 Transcript_25784/m.29478 type:complete len:188 (-) Transcript_25784:108-671(-)|eukprot:CAMPEP_0194156676 /NCGR_PEP_ID=MMETSP0152-20130528/69144_1 /TAXON_ID=1049557 /ORGANISM="Thalassiothrix antarctica, Strain L6-D1" /LENGTH=187 /DNA_ID=CAMNT_0038864531 /DNA_START=188 /DNA_END=751 /DNA_ORIENTATION=-